MTSELQMLCSLFYHNKEHLTHEFKDYCAEHRLNEMYGLYNASSYYQDPTRKANEYVHVYYEVEGKRGRKFNEYWASRGGISETDLPKRGYLFSSAMLSLRGVSETSSILPDCIEVLGQYRA